MVFDCHAHIASSMILPQQWYGGWMQHVIEALPGKGTEAEKRYIQQLFQYLNHDDHCERLIRQMDEAGIDKTTLLIIDWGLTYPELTNDLEEVMEMHKKALKAHPDRFWIFAGIDPRRGKEGLDLFEKSIRDWGFKGLKLYPPCGFSPSDDIVYPYYEICEQYGLPVLSHIGPSSPSLRTRFAMPIELDTAAWQFPKVNFILGHGAFTHSYDCSLLAAHRNNIYLDMSGFQTLSNEKLEKAMKHLLDLNLHKKLLFGTDWPIHFFAGSQKGAIARIRRLLDEELIDPDTYEGIMYKNFQHLMN